MRAHFPAGLILCGVALAGPAAGQQPAPDAVGAQREVQAVSVCLKTGWRGKKEVNETYGAPPGYVIVEHRVDLKKKEGNANYSVSILPDKFTAITAEEVNSTYDKLADAAARLHLLDYQAKLQLEQKELLKRFELKSVSSGVITVKASIEGSGELEFVVYAKILNSATNVSLKQVYRRHLDNLRRLAANPKCRDLKDVLHAEDAWLTPESAVCDLPADDEPSPLPRGTVPSGFPCILLPFPSRKVHQNPPIILPTSVPKKVAPGSTSPRTDSFPDPP